MRDLNLAIFAASYSGNKGAAAMLQSSIAQLKERYGERLGIRLMSVYPKDDRRQLGFDCITVVNAKPQRLLFVSFPLAILYRVFSWCAPIRALLAKDPILHAYLACDLAIDESGVAFVDERGFVMNTYAFVTDAVPLLLGVPVVKYSQALGGFRNVYNRILAKWILPKLSLICARGEKTRENLRGIGITENVRLCADGAFSMADSPNWNETVERACTDDSFFGDRVVGLSVSSVVEARCRKRGIDYVGILAAFADTLSDRGYSVWMFANAAREGSDKPRGNDLLTGDRVFEQVKNREHVRWCRKEMPPEQIRAYLAHCRYLVASRFHAMIGALEKKVPVLLIGWSHKYQEVLDQFGLGRFAIDYKELRLETLLKTFDEFAAQEQEIRHSIEMHYDAVIESSRENIELISEQIDRIPSKRKRGTGLLDTDDPDRYIGPHLACRSAYAVQETIRENAASGGVLTALLCDLLERGEIDGAWVTRSEIREGEIGYRTWIATTRQELLDASSSVYLEAPLLRHLDQLRSFPGRVAAVLTPCMLRALDGVLEKEPALKEKVRFRFGLFCSGVQTARASHLAVEKAGLPLDNAVRIYYRRGHWRGRSAVLYADGTERTFSYKKTFCAYKNAFFFAPNKCLLCQDHFAHEADISFGDLWLRSMKKSAIKRTGCILRSAEGKRIFDQAVESGAIHACRLSDADVVRSQKRALVFQYHAAAAKGIPTLDTSFRCKWNHRLAYRLASGNRRLSEQRPDLLRRIPTAVVYAYMCAIRLLLNF